jgi:uncharacterized secreted protein with C-terminal beta-propeller domain
MATTETVVGAKEATRNRVALLDVDDLKTGTVYEDGRVFLNTKLTGEYVEYTLTRGEVHGAGSVDGPVVVHDAETMDQSKVLHNGSIHVGQDYAGEEVTVAYHILDESEMAEIGTLETQE